MKTLLTILLCIVVLLPGCTYGSTNLIRIQGTHLDASVNPITNSYNIKGDDVAATIYRQSGMIKKNKDGSTEKPLPMPDIIEGPQSWRLDNAPQVKSTASYTTR